MNFLRKLVCSVGFFVVIGFDAIAEEAAENESQGSLFDRLKKVVDTVTPGEDEPSLLERAKELGSRSLELGEERLSDLLEDGLSTNWQMADMLSYLDEAIAGRKAAFTNEQVQRWAGELIPLVEELNGRDFTTVPEVAITGNFEMIQILGNDLVPQYEKRFPDSSKTAIYLRSYLSAGLFAPALLGKYGVTNGVVYVLPVNLRATMEAIEVPESVDEDLIKLIIAHELTHALQDQYIDLNGSILETDSEDENLAFQAVMEGHAVYVQNEVAQRLGLKEAEAAGRKMLKAPEQSEEQWLTDRVSLVDALRWESIYLGGETFISHHFAEGGAERIWALLADPPKRTSMIVKPDTYRGGDVPAPDYMAKYSGVSQLLGIPDWKVDAQSMGDFAVQAHLSAIPRSRREAIMQKLTESAYLHFINPTDSFQDGVEASVLKFSDSAGAGEMLDALDQINQDQIRQAESSKVVELLEDKTIPYDAGGGLEGSATRYRTKAPVLGEQTISIIQVAREDLVAQLVFSNIFLEKTAVDALLENLVSELQ